MSNRLTFGEAEFLLGLLREVRGSFVTMSQMNPSDIGMALQCMGKDEESAAIAGNGVTQHKRLIYDKIEKLDGIINKIEGLFSL